MTSCAQVRRASPHGRAYERQHTEGKTPFEFRVGLSPAGVEILTGRGHQVYVEHEAGIGAGFEDREYEQAGGRVVYSPEGACVRGRKS